jgi:hypothetical protein
VGQKQAREDKAGEEQNGRWKKPNEKIFEVDNVEDVENGGKKCLRFSLLSVRSIFSDFSCQVPIDIFIPHP